MKVKVDDYLMKKLSNQLSENSSDLDTEIKKIINIVDRIKASWQGEDATKYVDIMQEKYILGLRGLQDVIDEYSVYLKNIPEVYEILDDAYSSKHIEV